jgi:hypothetical protein
VFRSSVLAAVVLGLVVPAFADTRQESAPSETVMHVGGRGVTAAELARAIDALPPPQQTGYREHPIDAARWWGRQTALADEAMRRGLAPATLKQQNDPVQRANALVAALVVDILRKESPTSQDVASYYNAHLTDFRRAHARHIVVSDRTALRPRSERTPEEARTRAADLAAQIRGGADFNRLAALQSDDRETAAKGGDLGSLAPNGSPPETERWLWSLAPGELSPPYRTAFGYEILRVDDRATAALSEVSTLIVGRLESERVERELDRIVLGSHLLFDQAALGRMAATP